MVCYGLIITLYPGFRYKRNVQQTRVMTDRPAGLKWSPSASEVVSIVLTGSCSAILLVKNDGICDEAVNIDYDTYVQCINSMIGVKVNVPYQRATFFCHSTL